MGRLVAVFTPADARVLAKAAAQHTPVALDGLGDEPELAPVIDFRSRRVIG